MPKCLPACLVLVVAAAAMAGGNATYVGGTLAEFRSGAGGTISSTDPEALVFAAGRSTVRIPYRSVKAIEYGQNVNRRVVLAYAVSPMFLLLKARKHFVTLQFTGEAGQQQAIVLRVDKNLVRPLLASLEARTGRVVEYQDDNARRTR